MAKFLANAIVEITLPDELVAYDVEMNVFNNTRRDVKIGLMVELNDVVVRIPAVIGQANSGGEVITIKKLLLRGLHGDMLPVLDGENVVFFTTDKADKPLVVGGVICG